MANRIFLVVLHVVFTAALFSQEGLKYQLPPEEIVRIVDAPVAPALSVSPDRSVIVLAERVGR